MAYKRYENCEGFDVQSFVDKSLITCPLCEKQPNWHINFKRHHKDEAVNLRCENCYAILKIELDHGVCKDEFKVISHGVYVKNDLDENCSYKFANFNEVQKNEDFENEKKDYNKSAFSKIEVDKKINYSNTSWSFLSTVLVISLILQILAIPILLIFLVPSNYFTTLNKSMIFVSLIFSILINWAVFSTLASMHYTIEELCEKLNKEQVNK